MEELLFGAITNGWAPLAETDKLQTKLDAIQTDVEMTESRLSPELIEEAKRDYLKDLISAANGYLSELWQIGRKTQKIV